MDIIICYLCRSKIVAEEEIEDAKCYGCNEYICVHCTDDKMPVGAHSPEDHLGCDEED